METAESSGISEFMDACRRRRRILAGAAIPVPLAAVLLALFLPGTYQSSATFAIEESRLAGFQGPAGQRDSYADQYVKDLDETIRRPASLERMLEATGQLPANQRTREAAVAAADKDINVRIVSRQVLDPQTGREKTIISSFSVSSGGRTPTEAQERTGWLAKEFVTADRENRQQRAAAAAEFMTAETERRRITVAAKEKQLADFKQRNIGALPEINQLNLDFKNRAERDLQDAETHLRTLQRERDFVAQQLQQARTLSPSAERLQQLEEDYRRKAQLYDDSHPDMVALRREIDDLRSGGQTGASLSTQLASEQAALTQALTRYSPEHPDIKRLQRRVAELQARVATGETTPRVAATMTPVQLQLTSQLNSLNSQIASVQSGAAETRGRISSVQGQITATPQVERQYAVINQDVSAARQAYQDVLQRKIEAESAQEAISSGSVDAFRMIQKPTLPKSTAKGQKLLVVIVGMLMGGVLGVAGMLLAEIRDSTVRSTRDVFKILGVASLGVIPVIANSSTMQARTRGRFVLAGSITIATVGLFAAGYGLLGS